MKNIITLNRGTVPDLGISIIILYTIIIAHMLTITAYKKTLGFSIINKKRSFIMSDILFNSNKISGIFLIILFSILTVWLLVKQKFLNHSTGILAIIFFIISNILLMSLFKFKNNILIVSGMFLCSALFVNFSMVSYNLKYNTTETNEITITSYTLLIIVFLTLIFNIINYFITSSLPKRLLNDLIGIFNVLYIIFIVVFIYYISMYPTLDETPITVNF